MSLPHRNFGFFNVVKFIGIFSYGFGFCFKVGKVMKEFTERR